MKNKIKSHFVAAHEKSDKDRVTPGTSVHEVLLLSRNIILSYDYLMPISYVH